MGVGKVVSQETEKAESSTLKGIKGIKNNKCSLDLYNSESVIMKEDY